VIAVVQKVCYTYSYPISLCDMVLLGHKLYHGNRVLKKTYFSWTASNGNTSFQKFKESYVMTRSNKVRATIVKKTFVSMYFMLKNKESYRFPNETIYARKIRDLKKYVINLKSA